MADLSAALVASTAAAGAIAAAATTLSHPRIAFTILFLLASFSRATLETPLGTMRPEMPAITLIAAVLLIRGQFRTLLDLPRETIVMVLAFGTYLAALGLSSAFIAPGKVQSLLLVAWLAISMLGGTVAFILIRPRPLAAIEPLAFGGALMGAIGIAVAAVFLVGGPSFTLGIQEFNSVQPRVYALGWETNLYASFLGMCAFFAVETARSRRRAAGLAMLALMLVGFGLGFTRAAYIGLAFGVAAYAGVRLLTERRVGDLVRLGATSGALLLVGIVAVNVLLPNASERSAANGSPVPTPGATVVPSRPQATASGVASHEPSIAPSGAGSTTAEPPLESGDDTIAFRLERVPIALMDLPKSPLIGFGAESFGQLHPERYAGPGPDHIAIMAIAVLHDSGLIGFVALTVGFILLIRSLWRVARRAAAEGDWRTTGAAAAFVGSVVSVLVAYQGNNAIHLAINWIIMGAATALTVRGVSADQHPSIP